MKWKIPGKPKVYEALGVVADKRIEVSGDEAKVYSSSGNKFYDISYDASKNAIMCNDNSSYWKGDLGYPAIAYLMKVGVLEYDENLGELLKGVPWKDLNVKFKNNFDKTVEYILEKLTDREKQSFELYVEKIIEDIKELDLNLLGKKAKPPEGY
ncbi:MAG: hypothetical protein JWN37_63 [Candidatus Nomurabacteria bacterium]|nr:hypothetical protein [Candidatus Nomurabacteria bacterium]